MNIREALSTDRDVRQIARDASLADIVADFKSGVFADSSKYSRDNLRYLLQQSKEGGERVITAFSKIADAQDIKRYPFWRERGLLMEKGREKLTAAHILAIRSGENGWITQDSELLPLKAEGIPNPSFGWGEGLPQDIGKFKNGDTVAHTLARFSRDWFVPEFMTLENASAETVLDALTASAGLSIQQQTAFEGLLRSSATEDEILKLLTEETLNKLNAKPAFKKYLMNFEATVLDPKTRETHKQTISDILKQKGVGGHEALGSLEEMLEKQQVQELSVYYREHQEDPVVLAEEVKILAVKNDTTTVAHEVAKLVDKTDQAILERPWVRDQAVLEKKDARGLTVAHYLAVGSLSSGWGLEGISIGIFSLTTDFQGNFEPNVQELGDIKSVHVEAGDSVAHYMARFNPGWTTTDETVLNLKNVRNETVSEVIRLRSGEATPLKDLTPDELQAFRARFKRLQYDAKELARTFRWLYLAEFENAEIEIERKGNYIIWKNGTWLDGEWLVGKWLNGVFKDGVWKSGNWEDGVFENGVWQDGEWDGGTWKGGKWLGGTWHNGVWENGLFQEGVWKNGEWKDGTWGHGVWLEGSYKGKKRQAGVWAGDVWEKEASEYIRPKNTGKFTAYQILGRFKSINGVRVPDQENPEVDEGLIARLIKSLTTLIDERHFPWLAYLDTDYENAEISYIPKGDQALRWLGGNWKAGKWGPDAIWMPKARGKFTGKDALGNTRNVPPTPENAGVWKVVPALTEEMVKEKGWLRKRHELVRTRGKQGGENAPVPDKVKSEERPQTVAAAQQRAREAKAQTPATPEKGDKAVSTGFTNTKP